MSGMEIHVRGRGRGGGVLKNKCPYGAMYNFLGEKCSSSSDKHYYYYIWWLKTQEFLSKKFCSKLDSRKTIGHLIVFLIHLP